LGPLQGPPGSRIRSEGPAEGCEEAGQALPCAEGAPVDYYDEEEAEEALREAEAIVGAVRRWRGRLRSA